MVTLIYYQLRWLYFIEQNDNLVCDIICLFYGLDAAGVPGVQVPPLDPHKPINSVNPYVEGVCKVEDIPTQEELDDIVLELLS